MASQASNQTIAIMGAPVSSGNRGVLALGNALVQLCTRAVDDAVVVFLEGNKDAQPVRMRVNEREILVPVVNYRLSPRAAFHEHLFWIVSMSVLYRIIPSTRLRQFIIRSTPWIECVAKSKLVGDVRGGDSFSDIYGMKRFLIGFLPVWSVLLIKGNIVLFPQTYGPYKNPVAKTMAKFILKRASIIMARDETSRQLAANLAGPSKQIQLSPDVAFGLPALIPDRLVLDPPLKGNLPKGTLGLNVNGLMFNGGYSRRNMFGLKLDYPSFLKRIIVALLTEQQSDILLVPHTYAPSDSVESDNQACRDLRAALPKDLQDRVRVVATEYDQQEIKGIIGMCDMFVGSRMHSCIAALSQGIPCIGVAYSRKFKGVFETVGVGDWVVDARDTEIHDAVERIIALYRLRNQVRDELSRNAQDAGRWLTKVFRTLGGAA